MTNGLFRLPNGVWIHPLSHRSGSPFTWSECKWVRKCALMVPSGICFCHRRMGAPRPMSNTSRIPAASTSVLFPNRSAAGIGLPVPSSVTVMLPSPPPMPVWPLLLFLVCGRPELPVISAVAPCPEASPAPACLVLPSAAPPVPARPPPLLLQAPTAKAAIIATIQHFDPAPFVIGSPVSTRPCLTAARGLQKTTGPGANRGRSVSGGLILRKRCAAMWSNHSRHPSASANWAGIWRPGATIAKGAPVHRSHTTPVHTHRGRGVCNQSRRRSAHEEAVAYLFSVGVRGCRGRLFKRRRSEQERRNRRRPR